MFTIASPRPVPFLERLSATLTTIEALVRTRNMLCWNARPLVFDTEFHNGHFVTAQMDIDLLHPARHLQAFSTRFSIT